jgi:hypothetical protein
MLCVDESNNATQGLPSQQNMKKVVYIVLGCGLLVAAVGTFVLRDTTPSVSAPVRQTASEVTHVTEAETKLPEPGLVPETTAQPILSREPVVEPEPPKKVPATPVVAAAQPKKKPPIKDPAAREALALVGAGPEAELYWYSAINDFSLSAHERQDLIEDLNEDGLSNPAHPTIQDLPLILSRIDLIENVGPETMDPVNAAAFEEAYKDLVNLARKAASGGQME